MTNDVSIALPVESAWIQLLRWFAVRLVVYLAVAILTGLLFIAGAALYAHYSPTSGGTQEFARSTSSTVRSSPASIGDASRQNVSLIIQVTSFVVTILLLIVASRRRLSLYASSDAIAADEREQALEDADEHAEIAGLLPWYATGGLGRRDNERVQQALAASPKLAQDYDHIKEEVAATIHLYESLGAPSSVPSDKLFAAIDADGLHGRARSTFSLGDWLSEKLTSFSPRTLAWSGTAAVIAVVLQAGLLAGMFVNERSSHTVDFSPAVFHTSENSTFLSIRFAPEATSADVTSFLEKYRANVVAGPRSGGRYFVVIDLPSNEVSGIVQKMLQEKSKVISSIEVDPRR